MKRSRYRTVQKPETFFVFVFVNKGLFGTQLSGNSNLNLDTSLDVDDDLLNGLGGSVKTIKQMIISIAFSRGIPIYLSCIKRRALIGAQIRRSVLTQSGACGFSSQTYPRSWNPHRWGSF